MSRNYPILPLLVIAVTFVSFLPLHFAAKNTPTAIKSDVKYIKCEVCEELAKQLTRQVKKKKESVAPKKITELQIVEIVEKICNLKKNEGEWLMAFDIVESGDKLKLVEQSLAGECNSECKTIQKACDEILGDHDTDVAEAIYSDDLSRSALSQLLCRKLTKSCVGKVPPVPKDRKPGEKFVPVEAEKAKMERMLRDMNDIPNAPKMKMYSRDDLMKNGVPGMKGLGGEEEEEEEEEEQEEEKAQQKPSPKTSSVKKPEPEAEPKAPQPKVPKSNSQKIKEAAKTGSVAEIFLDRAAGVADKVKEVASKGIKAASDFIQGFIPSSKDTKSSASSEL